jgi:hypothetical protein
MAKDFGDALDKHQTAADLRIQRQAERDVLRLSAKKTSPGYCPPNPL